MEKSVMGWAGAVRDGGGRGVERKSVAAPGVGGGPSWLLYTADDTHAPLCLASVSSPPICSSQGPTVL